MRKWKFVYYSGEMVVVHTEKREFSSFESAYQYGEMICGNSISGTLIESFDISTNSRWD